MAASPFGWLGMVSKRRPRPKRPDKRGRGGRQWIDLDYSMVRCAAFRGLSGAAVKVFLELRSRYNGGNNGSLHLSYREAAALLGLSKSTVKRAFDELQNAGFIFLVKDGDFYQGMAHEWRCTDIRYNDNLPTRDWIRMSHPDNTRAKAKGRNGSGD